MSVEIIYFVHGTTFDNASYKCSGWKDVMLNDLGIQQAIDLGKSVDYKFDALFTSDLTRAVDSANLAFPEVEKIIDKRLRECNYGDYDGLDKNLVVFENYINKPFPNGESLKDVENRIRDFVEFLKDNYNNKTVGIVAHRAPQLALEIITNNLSWEEAIENDWRKKKAWQPGWKYIIND